MKTSTIIWMILGLFLGIGGTIAVIYFTLGKTDPLNKYEPGGELEVVDEPHTLSIPTEIGVFEVEDVEFSMKGQQATLRSTEDYSIEFDEGTESFQIIIYTGPFETTRRKAEQAFLDALQIPKDIACELDVTIMVSRRVSEELSGQPFNLSYCEI